MNGVVDQTIRDGSPTMNHVMPGPGKSSASGQAQTPRVPQSGVIGVMIKVSAPPSEYAVDGLVHVRERG